MSNRLGDHYNRYSQTKYSEYNTKQFDQNSYDNVWNKEIKTIDAPTVVLIFLHAVSGIESWHRSTKKITATELEQNMVTILIDGLKLAK